MESVTDQPIFTTGEGRVQVLADEARLWVALSSRNPDRSLAVSPARQPGTIPDDLPGARTE